MEILRRCKVTSAAAAQNLRACEQRRTQGLTVALCFSLKAERRRLKAARVKLFPENIFVFLTDYL